MNIVSSDSIIRSGAAGMSVDMGKPAHLAYSGAAVVGGAAIVGSVGVVAVAAPGMVLVPAAAAGGLVALGYHLSKDDESSDEATASKPAEAKAAA